MKKPVRLLIYFKELEKSDIDSAAAIAVAS
jgi:hypothetical protein